MRALPAWNPFAPEALRFVPNMFEEAGGPARARRARCGLRPPGGSAGAGRCAAARWRAFFPRSQWRWRGQRHRRGPSPSEAQARCGLPTWEPPRVCVQKCAGAGQARFPGNPAVLFPEVPPLVPPWRPSLPVVEHMGGNKETPRGTQRRNQALVCDNVLRKSGPCVRNREQRAKRRPHSHDNKPVGRSARGAARRSAEPGPGIPNRLGADFPRGAVEPSRILGGRPARARNRPGVRPGRYRPGPARRSRGGLRP